MKDSDYIVKQGWMYNLLPDLTLREREVYAIIYGFSHDGRSRMRATARYLGEWAGCCERQAKNIIRKLEDRGLIAHEVVITSDGLCSEFWAVDPREAKVPEEGGKEKINWAGNRSTVGKRIARRGRETDCPTGREAGFTGGREMDFPTPNTVSRYSDITSSRGSKYNSSRSRAKKNDDDHHDVFNLFENESGLTPGDRLLMPFQEESFAKAWSRLMSVPAWEAKSATALQLVLDELGEKCDLSEAIFCVETAVRKEWNDIKPSEILARENPDNIRRYQTDAERAAMNLNSGEGAR